VNAYDLPPSAGELRQGEVIGPVWVHESEELPILIEEGQKMTSRPVEHRRLIALTNDCDLLWDFEARFEEGDPRFDMHPEAEDQTLSPNIIPGVVLCELFEKTEIRDLGMNAATWKQTENHKLTRYHRFPEAPVGESGGTMPVLVADFKRVTRLPPSQVYAGIRSGHVKRIARLPEIYTVHMVQRYSSYQARVALPDVR
jgi:hypothetical protein